eukprot:TRINITY_DN38482_c0_g1_i2.p1 TRINITY_DN38482_c0_g1~~TRINITY_DN38482_c0_g1_i2.p1  ORF type:complete len:685 (+),score=81.31 TRINITY_DN38482_c0_g1_i2:83-2056(+)
MDAQHSTERCPSTQKLFGGSESIFVSIASYRDSQCQYTIRDLFEKARFPERVVVGVCFQVSSEDEDNFLVDLSRWSDQIRTYFMCHTKAKGPCYARSLIETQVYRDEDFYLQIDSHMRFVQDWDVKSLAQLAACQSPRAVLTSYVSSYTLPNTYQPGAPDCACLSSTSAISVLCADRFGDGQRDDPFLRIKTRVCREELGKSPPKAMVWTARFAFSRGCLVREVPYDPLLEYLFFGEEIAMSARIWTAGWDMFNPTEVLAYHLASRAHRPWFREVQTSPEQVAQETNAKHRVCGLLGHLWPQDRGHEAPAAPYGLGSARSLRDYEAFAGISFRDQIVHERGRFGGLPADMFAPEWAEEQRAKVAEAAQLADPASWAGSGTRTPQHMQPQKQAVRESIPRPLALMRVQALQTQRARATEEEVAEIELQLCKAFLELGHAEQAAGEPSKAVAAYERAAEHATDLRLNRHDLPSWAEEDDGEVGGNDLWLGSIASAEAQTQLAMKGHSKAKKLLQSALDFLGKAFKAGGKGWSLLSSGEQLAADVLHHIHAVHEQTDDRAGIGKCSGQLELLVRAIHTASGEAEPLPLPVLQPSSPPPEGVASSLRARLLESAVLLSIATGEAKDIKIARLVFTHFKTARESPNLVRLLGMLQSSGHLCK